MLPIPRPHRLSKGLLCLRHARNEWALPPYLRTTTQRSGVSDASVCKASVKAMLSSSFRHPRPAYHAQVVTEMKQMLRVYLESLRA